MITDMKDAKIFSPLQLGRTTLKNRIAMAPMSMHYEATNGTVPKQLADIFVRRAEGGAGYVVIDAVTVDHKYWYIGKTTALDKDSLVPQFAAFAKRVSDAGSTLFPQLIHPGPESICALKGITPLGPSVNTNANGAVSRPIGRHTKCQWVGSKHILNTKCRCNGWSCVGTADTDHILFCCETCPISCDSIMGRVTDCNHTHAVFMCFFNTHVHSLLAGYHSHTIVSIKNCSCRCLFKNIDLCYRI